MKTIHTKNSQQGSAMLIAVLFFMTVGLIVTLGMVGPALREFAVAQSLMVSKQSYFLAESGIEDAFYRIRNNKQIGTSEVITLDGNSATTTIADSGYNQKSLTSLGSVNAAQRKVQTVLLPGVGVAFNYGMQVGNGGIDIGNATITGNVYSNGNIIGDNGARVTGSAVAANQSRIDNIDIGTTASDVGWAHQIDNTTTIGGGKLYCSTGSSNSPACLTTRGDAPPQEYPIADEEITEWKDDALVGGTTGSVTVSNDMSIGPKKVDGNLSFSANNKTLTLNGTLWITGNLTVTNGSTIKLATAYGGSSGVIIVDGTVNISNGGNFVGSGTSGSYVMVATTSTTNPAISVGNNAGAVVLVALNSTVYFAQNGAAKAVMADHVELENNSTVTYESGLIDANFTNGPGGTWNLKSWKEVQ